MDDMTAVVKIEKGAGSGGSNGGNGNGGGAFTQARSSSTGSSSSSSGGGGGGGGQVSDTQRWAGRRVARWVLGGWLLVFLESGRPLHPTVFRRGFCFMGGGVHRVTGDLKVLQMA